MPRGIPGHMAYHDVEMLEYDALTKELNELDGVCTYYRDCAKDSITMIYGDGFPKEIILERDEAERKLDFLRMIKGLPPREKTVDTKLRRHPWHKIAGKRIL